MEKMMIWNPVAVASAETPSAHAAYTLISIGPNPKAVVDKLWELLGASDAIVPFIYVLIKPRNPPVMEIL